MDTGALSSDAERLSDLIGAIYDCAIDPDRWETTLDDIRDFLTCANTTLYLYDTQTGRPRLYKVTGVEPYWQKLMIEYERHIAEAYDAGGIATRPLDDVFVLRRDLPDEFFRSNFYFLNWAAPQGIDDLVQITLLREGDRLAALAMGRYGKDGRITDREVGLVKVLAPHLRRAVAISDLIDMKTLAADALGSALDSVSVGVVLVGDDASILHANAAARDLLDGSGPLKSVGGKLRAVSSATNRRLTAAIASAASEGPEPVDRGMGIALMHDTASPQTAHVLPVTRGEVRSRLAPRAVAAIFITTAGSQRPLSLEPVAEAFGLTQAETRLLDRIVRGDSLDDAAAALSVAKTTARTHMSRLLNKTGTRRQAALVTLVRQLAPDLRSRGN